MKDQATSERYTELKVVERRSHVTGEMTKAFACAVEGEGTYFFQIIGLPDPMNCDLPVLDLGMASAGCFRLERSGELLWETSKILNRGGGMGNEWKLFFTGVPDDFIEKMPEDILAQSPHLRRPNGGSTQLFRANDFKHIISPFQVGDVVKLRNPKDPFDSIETQLSHQWERHKMQIEHQQATIDDPKEAHIWEVDVYGEEDAESEEDIVARSKQMMAQYLDQFSFEPQGTA